MIRVAFGSLALSLVLAGAAVGDDDDHDHDLALRALQEGRIKPLAEITSAVQARVPGNVIKVKLESEHGKLVYELKVLTPDGMVKEVEVDAANASILKVEDDD